MPRRFTPFIVFALLLLPTAAFAQDMGGMGGGMEGGMGGGGMSGGGGMGGGGGRHRGGPPGAGPGGPRMERAMKPISLADFQKAVAKQFAEADRDHDGFVTLDEIHAAIDARRDARIAKIFDAVDSNHDRKISPEEFSAWQRKMGDPEMAALAGADEAPAMPDGAVPMGAINRLIAPITAASLIEADGDHDMKLSTAEHMAFERKRFDALDLDKDGEISGEEMRAARGDKGDPRGGPRDGPLGGMRP